MRGAWTVHVEARGRTDGSSPPKMAIVGGMKRGENGGKADEFHVYASVLVWSTKAMASRRLPYAGLSMMLRRYNK